MRKPLQPQVPDHAVAIVRASVGAVPVLGSLFVELATQVIPNQRIDRVALYVDKLARRLDALGYDMEAMNAARLDPPRVALMEDGATTSARALSDERIDQIAGVVASGIAGPDQELDRERDLIALIDQLTDSDIAFLVGLRDPRTDVRWSWICKHPGYGAISYADIGEEEPSPERRQHDNDKGLLGVAWQIKRERRFQIRGMLISKLRKLELIDVCGEDARPRREHDEIFWPPESHEYRLSETGRYVLWRMGLMSDGLRYVGARPLRDIREKFGTEITDDMIVLMIDYGVRKFGLEYQWPSKDHSSVRSDEDHSSVPT